ncbi:hypothetical protein [Sphaerochaeta sp.]|jgi:hypothetical protein|uniref:hypothetical protein n=1 Tax=Sphaerochaeta sp. TaxID=1972642 RepID=UPI003D0E62CA
MIGHQREDKGIIPILFLLFLIYERSDSPVKLISLISAEMYDSRNLVRLEMTISIGKRLFLFSWICLVTISETSFRFSSAREQKLTITKRFR